MIASGHQPSYWPWLGFFHKMASCDVFLLWDDVPMESSGYENRCRILGTSGPQWLTVPVLRARNAKIKDVRVANEHDWRRKHLRAIELAYQGAPFWKEHADRFGWFYSQQYETLSELDEAALSLLLPVLGITTRTLKLSRYELTSSKTQLIVDACKQVGAWKFLFGALGVDYADRKILEAGQVQPFVQEFVSQPHVQRNGFAKPFEPGLWAWDAILNVGAERARELMLEGGKTRAM